MKKYFTAIFMLFLSSIYAQKQFLKGYFITDEGTKVDCFIKDDDWKNNPSEFTYKITPSAETKLGTVNAITSFTIPNRFKYEKYTVNIDKSSNRETNLSKTRNPEFEEKTTFLKLIVDGGAKLFSYHNGNLSRFFFLDKNNSITALIYKKYSKNGFTINENTLYKVQLRQLLKCSGLSSKKVSYNKKSLKNYFLKYNQCKNPTTQVQDYTVNETKSFLSINLKAGASFFDNNVKDATSLISTIDATIAGTSFKFGAELEYFLAFDNNNWSIIVNPNYQILSDKTSITDINNPVLGTIVYNLDYKSLETLVGFRKYFDLNKNSEFFLDAGINFNFPLSSTFTVSYERINSTRTFEPSSNRYFSVGAGYKFNKFALEARYYTRQDILGKTPAVESLLSSFSVMISYNVFNNNKK